MQGISFVIPNYNGRVLLEKYLPSVLREADLSRDEVIVVDDCSKDDSVPFLKEHFPSVRLIALPRNQGFARAVNTGVLQSRNRLVFISNTDVEALPGMRQPLEKHFSRPDTFAVSSMQIPVDGSAPRCAFPSAQVAFGVFLYHYQMLAGIPREVSPVLFCQGAATVYDRDKFLALGGFDPMYSPFYWEDLDLSFRAWKRGWRSLYEPASTHRHYIRGTTAKVIGPFTLRVIHWKNRFLFTWRNLVSPRLAIEQAVFMPFELFILPLLGKVEFTLGYFLALAQLPDVLSRRFRKLPRPVFSDADILRKFSAASIAKIPVSGRVRVLYLHETTRISGAENSLINLVRNLDRTLFEPSFVLPDDGPLAQELRSLAIDVAVVGFPKIRRLAGVRRTLDFLVDRIRTENACLVHSNSIRTHMYGTIVARRCGIRSVWHQRNLLQGEIVDPDRLLMFLPDRIICNSQAIARRFAKGGNIPDKVRVVFNGVDTACFNPSVDGGGVRNEFGILPEETVVGITSRFNLQKGHETLFKAAAAICAQDPLLWSRLKFLVAGGAVFESDKPREKYLKDMVRMLGISDRVIFVGYRNDMPQVYAAMDLFVLTSEAEACGRVVLEAMSSGKPVVATASGGTPEAVENGISGLLFRSGDYRDLAGKIIFLATNPDKASQMGKAARQRVERSFKIENNVSQIEAIYKEMIP